MGLFSKYIDFKIFLFSLVFGLFAVYMTAPTMRKIYVYPSPENINILQYKDKTNTCFSFKQTEVACPKDENNISKIPLQN
jgi:hypothetical protein